MTTTRATNAIGRLARAGLCCSLAFVLAAPSDAYQDDLEAAPTVAAETLAFDARAAEHLLSRAGFGATEAEVRRAVRLGLDATLDELFVGDPRPREPWNERLVGVRATNASLQDAPREERQKKNRELRRLDRQQLGVWRNWWVTRLLDGDDPLRERMVLFWHGHFPSSMGDVGNGHELIEQNRLFRSHALGNVRELTRRIARDAAMLEFLDNDENQKKKPNENFARELLELFTLGEGHYTEDDVRAVARAFTGWTDVDGRFVFRKGQHDAGQKTVLGVTDNLGGDDVVRILFEAPRCATFFAEELIAYFEGRPPEPARAARYATLLKEADFELEPFLRALFRDPAFYAPEVVGARITSPLDFLVGSARRLGVDPPAAWIASASELLGEALFEPPSVEGWPGGETWITTSSLIHRGNFAGVLSGALDAPDLARVDGQPGKAARKALDPTLRTLAETSWRARPNLGRLASHGDAEKDGELVRTLAGELLAVDLDEETLKWLVRQLKSAREEEGLDPATALLDAPARGERVLRRLAHLILSLPEAQLH